MSNLQLVLLTLVPIFALIGLGYALRRVGFPGDRFWPDLERLVYYLMFPALLVEKLGTAQVSLGRVLWMAAAVVATVLTVAALVWLSRRAFRVSDPGFTSIFQGAIRFNTYIGIATALGLFGTDGAAVAAMVLVVMIPLVNVLCVGVLTHYSAAETSYAAILRGILRNPLIIGCAIGALLNFTGIGLPLGSDAMLEIVGRAALPMGLLTVGAGLQLRVAWTARGAIGGGLLVKLLVMPAVAYGFAHLLGLGGLESQVLVLFAALPTATSAYILARQLGGDAALMAGVLTAQTAASALTLPAWLVFVTT